MRNGRAPTMADAHAAAQVAESAGATQVLLFGSLARGDAKPGSDLDLVAVFDDLDYGERYDRECELNRAIEAKTGLANDVVVTDRPEWVLRSSGAVPYSFEPVIAQHAIKIIDNPPKDVIRWDKPMAVPTNPAEAATEYLGNLRARWSSIRDIRAGTERAVWRESFNYGSYQLARTDRFKFLNGQAHLAIEQCLKALIVLHCDTPPRYLHIHDTTMLTAELARHAPDQAELTDGFRGDVTHKDISSWHQRANYLDAHKQFDQPVSRSHTATLLRIAEAYTRHTVEVYLRHTGDDADHDTVNLILGGVETVAKRLRREGEGLDPRGLPGDKEPHPEEIEQRKTEQFLAQQRRARRTDPDGS